tara:strand:+ start:122 stop:292 length:171 start_codon:yes stop_codon:yes gene_type:complete
MITLTVKLTEEEIHKIKNAVDGKLKKDFESFIKKIDDAKEKEREKIYGKSCISCNI